MRLFCLDWPTDPDRSASLLECGSSMSARCWFSDHVLHYLNQLKYQCSLSNYLALWVLLLIFNRTNNYTREGFLALRSYDLRAFVMYTLSLENLVCVWDAWFSFGVSFGFGPPTLSSTADTLAICCLCDDAIFLVTHPGASWFKNNVWLHQGSSHKQGTQLSLQWPLWLVDNAGVKRPESW